MVGMEWRQLSWQRGSRLHYPSFADQVMDAVSPEDDTDLLDSRINPLVYQVLLLFVFRHTCSLIFMF